MQVTTCIEVKKNCKEPVVQTKKTENKNEVDHRMLGFCMNNLFHEIIGERVSLR